MALCIKTNTTPCFYIQVTAQTAEVRARRPISFRDVCLLGPGETHMARSPGGRVFGGHS